MTDDYNQVYGEKDLIEQFEKGRTQAISEFKEKLKEKLKKENSTNPDVNAIISRGQVLDLIDKTAQEIK